jgi:hypothetical protein
MAAVASREGVITMTGTDTHSPSASALVAAIIIDDLIGTGTLTIRKFDAATGPVVFSYTGAAAVPITKWYGIDKVLSTSGGLYCSATDCTAYIYIR